MTAPPLPPHVRIDPVKPAHLAVCLQTRAARIRGVLLGDGVISQPVDRRRLLPLLCPLRRSVLLIPAECRYEDVEAWATDTGIARATGPAIPRLLRELAAVGRVVTPDVRLADWFAPPIPPDTLILRLVRAMPDVYGRTLWPTLRALIIRPDIGIRRAFSRALDAPPSAVRAAWSEYHYVRLEEVGAPKEVIAFVLGYTNAGSLRRGRGAWKALLGSHPHLSPDPVSERHRKG